MARSIVVNYGGEVSEFALTRVERQKLYGRKRKVVVDENENSTQTAYLTRDGTALLPSGTIAMLYVDDDYNVASRSELVAVDPIARTPMDPVDSTLGVEQSCEGPIDPKRVLDHTCKALYQLDPDQVGDSLKEKMEEGGIFETTFAYRKGFEDAPAFLFKNDEGYFALIGNTAEFDYLRKETAIAIEEEEDEDPFDEDDLDFSMF